MAGRYRSNQETNRSRFYILLSVIFIFVMFKWGIPYFVTIIAGNGSPRQNQDKDIIPPQTPTLSALPEATNSASISIEGFTEANAGVEALVGDVVQVTGTANGDGSFSLTATLSAGQNRVYVRARDEAGNTSQSEVKLVIFDNKVIEVNIISPNDGSEFFGKNNQVVEIKGNVNKTDAQVVINNSFVLVDDNGNFLNRYQLMNGSNDISVVVTDKAGNSLTKKITLVYTP